MTTAIDPEVLFPPKKGGMVDTARKRTQAESAQLDEYNNQAGAPVPGTGLVAIRVRSEAPDTGVARSVTLTSAYPVARLLAADTGRRSSVILAIDNDVYITGSQGLANDVSGSATSGQAFYLPAGIAMPVDNQAELWVSATTTATNTRVSVLISRDSCP